MRKSLFFVSTSILLLNLVLAQSPTNTFPSSGNVGIGTTSPSVALDVVGGANSNFIYSRATDGSMTRFGLSNSSRHWTISNYGTQYSSNGDFAIADETAAQVRFLITASGSIGIGETNPLEKLVVNEGALKVSATYTNGIGGTINIDANGKTGGESNWRIYNMQRGVYGKGGLQFWNYPADGTSYGGCCNARMTITEEGNVGIGTTDPGNYKLAVEGIIGAREIKVTANSWADYVFDKKYKLRNLKSLEKYINQYKHLPGIPSAQEVKENGGIELGDMNIKLLEKIEELTLYIIQLNKENDALKKDNAEIKEMLKRLLNN